ncbi:MGH1-like glycoside hydrolase domain-containing protein [Leifsonia sp. Leaf264]|uniref:MGH1-like glycoside hydrolase domain-containing protein n=1 Tax=Leifsonia sp. Leaf264 TaxID=1736314 RepID=UPI000AA4A47F|nr:glucosidase [Leifsonia sp. Leaf264]
MHERGPGQGGRRRAADIDAESDRLVERGHGVPWLRWGPYLSERQWGTVREDYSADGDAWAYFPHDHARSRAYRWGEDGLAGISDDRQTLCFALALWNGADAILKERAFGLTNTEGNHGEDVKEYYFYLDNTPTHSYMRYLYKYPHTAYPYEDLVATNGRRSVDDFEYELIDTGAFAEDRYFDVTVEYAKVSPEDILINIEITNRGPEQASLVLLPTLWFRNTWSEGTQPRPTLERLADLPGATVVRADHDGIGTRFLYAANRPATLFCDNETNTARLFGDPNVTRYVKDGIGEAVVHGDSEAAHPTGPGTKVAAHYSVDVAAGATERFSLRLTDLDPESLSADGGPFGARFTETVSRRRREADTFYAGVIPSSLSADSALVMRQALAGLLWTKQFYAYDVTKWLGGHGVTTRAAQLRSTLRNAAWFHMVNEDIISMPDKWEYPWYAAWDLAFHAVSLAVVDVDFAKGQLALMLDERYLHPNGQIPAYEWNFSDVNPPVHAWAVMRVYEAEKEARGEGDLRYLEEAFHKLTLNYTWWVNRKDPDGNSVFGGGFLGLDNIGVFDRSAPLPTGGHLEQADGTAWMAFYALEMLEIALELARHDPSYQSMAAKFLEQYLWIAAAMDDPDDPDGSLWDHEDGFFYDVLATPDGRTARLKVRSLVGLLPLAACVVLRPADVSQMPEFMARVHWLRTHRPNLAARFPTLAEPGIGDRRLLSVLDETKLRRLLVRMLDESEFLSEHGIRSVSRYHRDHPFVVDVVGQEYRVDYLPAESNSGMFGGNSNWRGPIWFPMNFLLIRGLLSYASYYGDQVMIEYPTGSGRELALRDIAAELSERLMSIFLRDETGIRPVFGGNAVFQESEHWNDLIPFYEYFHGDNGAGLGASHQTGWTALVARMMQLIGDEDAFDAKTSRRDDDTRPDAGTTS